MVKCEVCGREFKDKRGLPSHMKGHKRSTSRTFTSLESILASSILPDFKRTLKVEIGETGALKLEVEVTPTKGESCL